MNNRGQLVVVGFMIAFFLFITVVTFIEPLKEQIQSARVSLDCENSSISTEEQMTCIQVGAALPLFVGIGMAVAIAYLGIKEYREGGRPPGGL